MTKKAGKKVEKERCHNATVTFFLARKRCHIKSMPVWQSLEAFAQVAVTELAGFRMQRGLPGQQTRVDVVQMWRVTAVNVGACRKGRKFDVV